MNWQNGNMQGGKNWDGSGKGFGKGKAGKGKPNWRSNNQQQQQNNWGNQGMQNQMGGMQNEMGMGNMGMQGMTPQQMMMQAQMQQSGMTPQQMQQMMQAQMMQQQMQQQQQQQQGMQNQNQNMQQQSQQPMPPQQQVMQAPKTKQERLNEMNTGTMCRPRKPFVVVLMNLPLDKDDDRLSLLLASCCPILKFYRPRIPTTGEQPDFGFVEVLDAESCWTIQHVLEGFEVKPGLKVRVVLESLAMNETGKWKLGMMHRVSGGRGNLGTMSEEITNAEIVRQVIRDMDTVEKRRQEWADSKVRDAKGRAEKDAERLEKSKEIDVQMQIELAAEMKKLRAFEDKRTVQEVLEDEQDRERQRIEQLIGSGSKTDATELQHLRNVVKNVKNLSTEDVMKTHIDWKLLRATSSMQKKLKPWVAKKIDQFMLGPVPDMVEWLLRMLNVNTPPLDLIEELRVYIGDVAPQFIEALRRMMIYEQQYVVITGKDKEANREQKAIPLTPDQPLPPPPQTGPMPPQQQQMQQQPQQQQQKSSFTVPLPNEMQNGGGIDLNAIAAAGAAHAFG